MKRSLRTLAERDFRDPFRSRSAWPTLVLFAAVFGLFVYAMGPSPGPSRPEFGQLLVAIVYLLVPLAALQFGYDRLSGPRQTGEVRLLLAPPHSRRDLLLGTALGRSAFTALVIVVSYLAAAAVFVVAAGLPELTLTLGGLAAALGLGVAMTAIAVGASAATATTARSGMVAIGAYFLFLLWDMVPFGLRVVLNGFSLPEGPQPAWAELLAELSPMEAYMNLNASLFSGEVAPDVVTASPPVAVALLVAWTVAPLLVGYARLRAVDL